MSKLLKFRICKDVKWLEARMIPRKEAIHLDGSETLLVLVNFNHTTENVNEIIDVVQDYLDKNQHLKRQV